MGHREAAQHRTRFKVSTGQGEHEAVSGGCARVAYLQLSLAACLALVSIGDPHHGYVDYDMIGLADAYGLFSIEARGASPQCSFAGGWRARRRCKV
jgi:hypothetical protein